MKTVREIAIRVPHLRAGLLASAVLLVLGLLPAALLRGGVGMAGVFAGVGLVAASYTVSSLLIAWVDAVDRRLVLPVGLLTYVLKFTMIGLVMGMISSAGWPGLVPMGVAILATALGWVAAQSWWTWHARIPYVDPGKS